MKKLVKYSLLVVAMALLFFGYQIISISGFGINSDHPGKVITHNLVNPSQLTEVSKFRSEAGHDFGGRGEKCLSMKHYFIGTHNLEEKRRVVASGVSIAAPDGKNDIIIYAPFDGYVTQLMKNHLAGYLLGLVPSKNSGIVLMLDHVFDVKPGLHSGPIPFINFMTAKIKAGEPIGRINGNEGFDVELRVGGTPWSDNWASYFSALTDSAYSEWSQIKNIPRSDYIITKDFRQSHPLKCIIDPKNPHANNKDFATPALWDDSQSYVIFKNVEGSSSESNSSPLSDSGVTCDKNHLGVTRTTAQGKLKCRLVADGRITWGPLEG